MDVVLVYNGLGNQMSQYALFMSKKALGQKVRRVFWNNDHNGIELQEVFGISTRMGCVDWLLKRLCLMLYHDTIPSVCRLVAKLGVSFFIEDLNHSFQPSVLEASKGLMFWIGGWHHPAYFESIARPLREMYRFPVVDDESNQDVLSDAQKVNAVAIHIRRGDYLVGDNYRYLGTVCTDKYYRNAISYMENRLQANPKFYVFSNDMQWSRAFMKGKDCIFVDWNTGRESWKDMYLMSQFGNLIISNSTFSWWAAYLGNRNKTVCRPPFFINNEVAPGFYLDDWIEISN